MQEIVVSVRRVTDVISEIAAASAEQLSGIEQVSHAVTQMDQVVQQNAALVEQSAAAAENQSAQSDALVRAVAKFNLGDERAGVTSASAQAPAIEARAKRIERRSPGTRSQAALPKAADASKRARRIRPADGTDGGDWKEF
jgi:methyl-accepting chemotaxis protein